MAQVIATLNMLIHDLTHEVQLFNASLCDPGGFFFQQFFMKGMEELRSKRKRDSHKEVVETAEPALLRRYVCLYRRVTPSLNSMSGRMGETTGSCFFWCQTDE